MPSINVILFLVIWSFPGIFDPTLITTAIPLCDDEDSMKVICVAVSHEYRKKTSLGDMRESKEKSVCRSIEPDSENVDLRENPRPVALCYVTNSQSICLLDNDNENEFYDLLYRESDGKCSQNPEMKYRSKTEYFKKGNHIEEGASAIPLPPMTIVSAKAICNDETSMKKICVGLKSDHKQKLSTKEAKEVGIKSKCIENVPLLSKTGYALDHYTAAVCYVPETEFKCLIDSYTEPYFTVVSYKLDGDQPTCTWSSRSIQEEFKTKYIEIGSQLLSPPIRKVVVKYVVCLFTLFIKC